MSFDTKQAAENTAKLQSAQLKLERDRLAAEISSLRRKHSQEIQQILASEKKARDQITHAFRSSASWRATAPLRALVSWVRRLSGRRIGTPALSDSPPALASPTGATTRGIAMDAKTAMRAVLRTRLDAFLVSSGRLKFPSHPEPDVSIVLVLYNSAELSYACLSSIAESCHGHDLRVEVVMLDNGSTDATSSLLERIDGATIIHCNENLHFLRGANRAASQANGKHLLFLNNDAMLMPGSLEAAVSTCESAQNVGAVGGRIILPDGTLQEAGSIVWRDGACVGYGRGRAPDAAEYMYQRDVDYCSGAFLLTPRTLFSQLGGFDERYAPAYYEETDYCLRLRQTGRRVVFDPRVVILHYEFGSASTSSQALALQQRNLAVFRDRHANWLKQQLSNAPANLLWARSAQSGVKRILVVEDRVPHENLGAGYPRSNELLRALVQGGAFVTLFPMIPHEENWPDIRASLPEQIEVMRNHSAQELRGFLCERRGYYDAILVCRPHNMRAFVNAGGADTSTIGGAAVIYDAEALFASRELTKRQLAGEDVSAVRAQRMISEEIALTRSAQAVVSVSEDEKQHFEAHGVGPVFVIGHLVESQPTQSRFEDRIGFLFVGAMHDDDAPNSESLRWFSQKIWPHVRAALGNNVGLDVVGYNRAPSVMSLAKDEGFNLVGAVDDLAPWYERARVVIAPTRIAAGIPLKAHGAASRGVPMVVTDLIAKQLGWESGTHLLAATDPHAFAQACVRLHSESALWQTIRDAALEQVLKDCSHEAFNGAVRNLLDFIPKLVVPQDDQPRRN